MTRYLIFKNPENSGNTNVPGSAQAVACDIARTVEMMGNADKDFVAYPDDSSEAMFESLKALPLFAVELDQQKIDMWINHAQPLLEMIDNVQDALGNAYSMIASAVQDLESHCKSSELFSDLDLTSDMDIDRAFDYVETPSEDAFVEKIAFSGFVPSDDISVYGVLDELGISDLDGTFNRALGEMYKFKSYLRASV